MHHIQRSIIDTLARTSPMRFSDLQPPRIPNNTFSYHLKKLLDTGYILMTDRGYIATRKALKTLSYVHKGDKTFARPAALVTLYVTNEKDEILLLKRPTQPFKDWLSVPLGLIHNDETLPQAAQRELQEKTTIIAEPGCLRMRGVLDFRYLEPRSKDTFVHAIGFIYAYKYVGDPAIITKKESAYGELYWSPLDDSKILPEVHEIAKIVAQTAITVRSVDFEEPIL